MIALALTLSLGLADAPAAAPGAEDYLRILSRFPRYAEAGWHAGWQERSDLGWFGSGASSENGQRTLANWILVTALLATDPGYDESVSGRTREELTERARMALRYWVATHRTGSAPCTDGKPWGWHWQSSWWTSKAVTGAVLLGDRLPLEERAGVLAVLADEADRLLTIPVPIGEFADTKSEENAWDSEALAWAVTLLPEHPSRAKWLTRYHEFCMNTLSIAADALDETIVEGRPVREWVLGPNIHSDFTIENHGFFHICYQSCPLHSFAWDVYALRRAGLREPATTHHHAREVYRTLLRHYLWDGRFAYLGGKDWPRYAYGLYFMIPALVVQQLEHGDRVARAVERDRVALLEREQLSNDDGSFFGGRFTLGKMEGWPSEWESDCACMLAMANLLHCQADSWLEPAEQREVDAAAGGVLLSHESEQISVRTPGRYAGVSWKAHRGPVGIVYATPETVHMAEWEACGSSSWTVRGATGSPSVAGHWERGFPGGFAACGEVLSAPLAPSEAADPAWRLELSDATTRCARLERPDHPLLTSPRRVTEADLAGLECLDSITAAGSGWEVLVRDERGNPAILAGRIGKGEAIVCMASAEQARLAGSPAGGLIDNAARWLSEGGRPVGWVRAEETGRQSLAAAGIAWAPVRWEKLGDYGGLFLDKSTGPELQSRWPAILRFVRDGGRVWKLCLQDDGWSPDLFGGAVAAPALRTDLALVALPDGASLVRIERTVALEDCVVERAEGLRWRVANDVFNGNRREFRDARGLREIEGVTPGGVARMLPLSGDSVVIDGLLTLTRIGPGPAFALLDSPTRRFGNGASLAAEDVLLPGWAEARSFGTGEIVAESVLLLAPGPEALARAREAKVVRNEAGVAIHLEGADGREYSLDVRWRSAPETIATPLGGPLATGPRWRRPTPRRLLGAPGPGEVGVSVG